MVPRLAVALVALAIVLVAAVAGGAASSAPADVRAADVRLERVGRFASPVHVTAPRGDPSRVFVVERSGRIRVVRNGRKLGRPFLDIRSRVSCCAERGLLSMAFAPDYATSRRFYVFFTDNTGDLRVVRYRTSSNPNRARRGTARSMMRVRHRSFPNHNGGQLAFGPDRLLYVSTGDGGGGNDPRNNAQRRRSLLGKILRINPKYPRRRPRVYSRGLRNPYRFSFDRETGDIAIGDVGEAAIEEVNFKTRGRARGANFGWDVFEGTRRLRGGTVRGHDRPVIQHSHASGWCSVIGGVVVRDRANDLYGRYVYGDHCRGEVYSARLSASGASGVRREGLDVERMSSFGEDALGRVYVASLSGPVWRLR